MAWKREEVDRSPDIPTRDAPGPPQPSQHRPATLGASITIKGDLAGDEDLVIEGRLEGKVTLGQHSVTIGRSGRLKADVWGKRVVVEGEVQGNLYGSEEVVIRKGGKTNGSAISPRVTLESGANFRGQIDMHPESVEKAFAAAEQTPRPPSARRPEAPTTPAAEKSAPVKAGAPNRQEVWSAVDGSAALF